MSTTTLSQIAYFSFVTRERRKGHLIEKASSLVLTPSRSRKFSCCMQLEGSSTQTPISEKETTLGYGDDASKLHVEGEIKSYRPNEEKDAEMLGVDKSVPEPEAVASPKKTTKIHDFCLGIPFALVVLLLYKNLENYFVTKKMFPAGFYTVISAAMLCFYSYVLASGGNPPPNKLKVGAAVAS